MDPLLSISQGLMKAALDKLLEQKDQTSEDGAKDPKLSALLAARVDESGLRPDKSSAGSVGGSSKISGAG